MWVSSWNWAIFLYQLKVSMRKCRRCESAADLVHFSSSAIKATMLQCSTLHPIVQTERCRIKGFCRPRALGHLRLWKSSAVSAPRPPCIMQLPHTHLQNVIHLHRQLRPENILTTGYTATSDFASDCTFWTMPKSGICCTQCSRGGLRLVLWIMQHDIVWLNAASPNWIPSNASSPPCLDKYWWKITASALIKEMEHFDPTLN